MTERRWFVVAGLGVALVGLLVADPGGARERLGARAVPPLPSAEVAGSLESTWFCAAGTATPGGPANMTVVVANTSTIERRGKVTWMPSGDGAGADVVVPFTVGAHDSVSLPALDSLRAPVVSAVVDADGDGIVVEHVVNGTSGSAVAPCASDPSPTWFLANGVTQRDATQVLALFNPFPGDTVVDIDFDTDLGREAPGALQGLPVPGRSTVYVEVGNAVRRRAATATAVRARVGQLVVDRVQAFDHSLGRAGVSLTLAATAPALEWFFPEGLRTDGVAQRWHVYNPTARDAEVSLQVVPDQGAAPEPVDLTVPARGRITVDAKDIAGLPVGAAHSSSVTAQNGVPVVVEREVDARTPRRGWSSSFGATRAARRWAFAVGEVTGSTDEWIVVHNPGTSAATFSVAALAAGELLEIEGLQGLRVPAAGRVAIRLGDHIARSPLPVVVVASAPVVAERGLYGVGRTLVATTAGIPFTAG